MQPLRIRSQYWKSSRSDVSERRLRWRSTEVSVCSETIFLPLEGVASTKQSSAGCTRRKSQLAFSAYVLYVYTSEARVRGQRVTAGAFDFEF